jgi:Inosine-uridine preferring nucleoside hydrolase
LKISRRLALHGAGAGLAALAISPATAAAAKLIPQRPSARVIVDNDFAGDPDGLVALAHQLLSPKAQVVLATSSALNPKFMPQNAPMTSAAEGVPLVRELIRRGRFGPLQVLAGTEDFSLGPSLAAQAIVAEAMRDDPLPLFLTCGGPLTNVAAALRLEPAIAKQMAVIWIGGGDYPNGGWEYNLATDLPAARAVIEGSTVPLWQVPQTAYRQMQYAIAEMTAELRPISSFSRWLYDRFTSPPDFVDLGGTWPLGDSPLVLLTALSSESSRSVDRRARQIDADCKYGNEIADRTIRVYEELDARLTFADFIAKLRLHSKR